MLNSAVLDGSFPMLMREACKLEKREVGRQRDIKQTGLRVRGHQPDTRGGKKALPPRGRPMPPVQPKVAYHSSSLVHPGQSGFNIPACSFVPIL